MAVRKVPTEAQKNAAKDKRLQKKYGITLAQQNEMRDKQDNRCKICGVPFSADIPACTDHFHFKVRSVKLAKGYWKAVAFMEKESFSASGTTKKESVENVRFIVTPSSVRGLLCIRCNRGLGYLERFFDAASHPDNLIPVMNYLWARLRN